MLPGRIPESRLPLSQALPDELLEDLRAYSESALEGSVNTARSLTKLGLGAPAYAARLAYSV